MQFKIKLTESEIKKAVFEYLESATNACNDVALSEVEITIEREPESGEYSAVCTFEETTGE